MFPTAQAGALLRGMAERGERRTRNDGRSRKVSHDAIPLADLDILPDQSSRWQRMAEVPEKVIAEYAESVKEEGEATSAGVLRLERQIRRDATKADGTPPLPSGKLCRVVDDKPTKDELSEIADLKKALVRAKHEIEQLEAKLADHRRKPARSKRSKTTTDAA